MCVCVCVCALEIRKLPLYCGGHCYFPTVKIISCLKLICPNKRQLQITCQSGVLDITVWKKWYSPAFILIQPFSGPSYECMVRSGPTWSKQYTGPCLDTSWSTQSVYPYALRPPERVDRRQHVASASRTWNALPTTDLETWAGLPIIVTCISAAIDSECYKLPTRIAYEHKAPLQNCLWFKSIWQCNTKQNA